MADWQVKVLEVKESVLADNDVDANVLRQENRERGICYYNLMSSPGAGKTTFLKGTIMRLKDTVRFGVMEADIDSDVDAQTIARLGVPILCAPPNLIPVHGRISFCCRCRKVTISRSNIR